MKAATILNLYEFHKRTVLKYKANLQVQQLQIQRNIMASATLKKKKKFTVVVTSPLHYRDI